MKKILLASFLVFGLAGCAALDKFVSGHSAAINKAATEVVVLKHIETAPFEARSDKALGIKVKAEKIQEVLIEVQNQLIPVDQVERLIKDRLDFDKAEKSDQILIQLVVDIVKEELANINTPEIQVGSVVTILDWVKEACDAYIEE